MTDVASIARIEGPNLVLRLIEPDDADFVYRLRTDPKYNAHLSQVTGTPEDQRAWIEAYKAREAAIEELYYVIERKDGLRCGLVRLYDITGEQFTWGSWILNENKTSKAALESAILSFDVGFNALGCASANVDVRIMNKHAEAFYRRLGMIETHRTEIDIYFEYSANKFNADKAHHLGVLEHRTVAEPQMSQKGSVRLIDVPQIHDPRGDLTFIEGHSHVPFDIARVYYLYNVPVDAERGGHAHKDLEQVVFALSGSFRMKVDDGTTKSEFWLRDPRKGLYINRLIWREMDSFSQGAVCMVLASHPYDETDYYRSYDEFLDAARKGS